MKRLINVPYISNWCMEMEGIFRAFSGTTIENYLKAAQVKGDTVYYDKLGIKEAHFPQLFFFPEVEPDGKCGFSSAAGYAVDLARYLEDCPVIISGTLYKEYEANHELPVGQLFPVDRVYVPRSQTSTEDLKDLGHWNAEKARKSFQVLDPLSLLNEYQEFQDQLFVYRIVPAIVFTY